MSEFERPYALLTSWYVCGDEAAFRAFFRAYVQPAVGGICRALDVPPALEDDAVQRCARLFLDRGDRWPLRAESAAYWGNRMSWRIRDLLRREQRRAKALKTATEALAATGSASGRLPGADAETGKREFTARLCAALSTLTPALRALFLVEHWPEFVECAPPDFLELVAERCGRAEPEVLALLESTRGGTLADRLPLLYSDEALAADSERCLESAERQLRRAHAKLRKRLSPPPPGPGGRR